MLVFKCLSFLLYAFLHCLLRYKLRYPCKEKPAKTDVSSRSSPLGDVSRGGTSVTQPQKFHTDDVKSVRNSVVSADWTTE